jgi:hypothetical protein
LCVEPVFVFLKKNPHQHRLSFFRRLEII